jgi:hypothetical protein
VSSSTNSTKIVVKKRENNATDPEGKRKEKR